MEKTFTHHQIILLRKEEEEVGKLLQRFAAAWQQTNHPAECAPRQNVLDNIFNYSRALSARASDRFGCFEMIIN